MPSAVSFGREDVLLNRLIRYQSENAKLEEDVAGLDAEVNQFPLSPLRILRKDVMT